MKRLIICLVTLIGFCGAARAQSECAGAMTHGNCNPFQHCQYSPNQGDGCVDINGCFNCSIGVSGGSGGILDLKGAPGGAANSTSGQRRNATPSPESIFTGFIANVISTPGPLGKFGVEQGDMMIKFSLEDAVDPATDQTAHVWQWVSQDRIAHLYDNPPSHWYIEIIKRWTGEHRVIEIGDVPLVRSGAIVSPGDIRISIIPDKKRD